MEFITNALRENAVEYVKDSDYLPTMHDIGDNESLVIGDPKPTEKYDVEGLKKFGVVGIYKIGEE